MYLYLQRKLNKPKRTDVSKERKREGEGRQRERERDKYVWHETLHTNKQWEPDETDERF